MLWMLALMFNVSAFGAPEGARCQIRYLEPERAIWVHAFPRDRPATLDDILEKSREHGWNVIEHEAQTDVYRLQASLWIGGVASWTSTYMHIGRPGHERETLILDGNLWIRPPRRYPRREDGSAGIVNRLTLGDPQNPSISATLRIACETSGQYGVLIGNRCEHEWSRGGELHVYGSTMTAAVADDAHRLRGAAHIVMQAGEPPGLWGLHTGWYGNDVRLIGAEVSWIQGKAFYGTAPGDNASFRGTTFSHCDVLAVGSSLTVTDCTFSDLSCPLVGSRITYVRCRFRNNEKRWELKRNYAHFVEMINCDVGESKTPLRLYKNDQSSKRLVRLNLPVYPFYIERCALRLKVRDGSGKPVKGAVVSLVCPDDSWSAEPGVQAVGGTVALTDEKGKTPCRLESGAILPAVQRWRATDDPEQPERHKLRYRLRVIAEGYKPFLKMLSPVDMETGAVEVSLEHP